MENYIDDATLTPLFDTCPIMRKALAFLESIIPLLVQISSLTPLEFIRSFWNDFRGFLCPMTEGGFLANFLHLGSVVLKTVGSDAAVPRAGPSERPSECAGEHQRAVSGRELQVSWVAVSGVSGGSCRVRVRCRRWRSTRSTS